MWPDWVSNLGPLALETCRSTTLFAIIYLNLEIYYIVREKLSNIFSYCVLEKQRHTSHRCSTCMTPRRRCFTPPSSVLNGMQ